MRSKNLCGDRLRLARKKQKMTQETLASKMKFNFDIILNGSMIGKIERKERGLYEYELLAFSEILEVPVMWLLKGDLF
jgi:transcriptional regulator with XRE-family HTH domain